MRLIQQAYIQRNNRHYSYAPRPTITPRLAFVWGCGALAFGAMMCCCYGVAS